MVFYFFYNVDKHAFRKRGFFPYFGQDTTIYTTLDLFVHMTIDTLYS